MRQLVLVRHGESRWNVERRIQGQAGSGLSDLGRSQAEHTADWLAATWPGATVVSSDLERCRETVAPLEARLGLAAATDRALRERDFGTWSGQLLDDIRARDRDRWERWRTGEDVIGEVGGETSDQLATRVVAALTRLVGALDDDGVVVAVTHGGPVWHGTHAMLGVTSGILGGVANASVTVLGSSGGSAWLQAWNQVGHLPVDAVTSLRPAVGRTSERATPPVGR
ncbi:MAG: histidine phosphatase family protein [Actinobacteria bacterium]|nr:histidine phosphatase family protein [Actinomycetota bacterium]